MSFSSHSAAARRRRKNSSSERSAALVFCCAARMKRFLRRVLYDIYLSFSLTVVPRFAIPLRGRRRFGGHPDSSFRYMHPLLRPPHVGPRPSAFAMLPLAVLSGSPRWRSTHQLVIPVARGSLSPYGLLQQR
jgi:hypothetical protein